MKKIILPTFAALSIVASCAQSPAKQGADADSTKTDTSAAASVQKTTPKVDTTKAEVKAEPKKADVTETIRKRVKAIFAYAFKCEVDLHEKYGSQSFKKAVSRGYDITDEYLQRTGEYHPDGLDYDPWIQGQDVVGNPHITISSINQDSETACTVKIKIINGGSTPATLKLVLENGKWMVDDFMPNGWSMKEWGNSVR